MSEENSKIQKNDALVAILLCTFNGAAFLEEQLNSFNIQTYKNWILVVSDDHSTDDTKQILSKFKDQQPSGKVLILDGPNEGFARNFLSLTAKTCRSADYFAWADQDDIWLPDKIERAIGNLKSFSNKKPSLYCGRTLLITSKREHIGYSKPIYKQPCFQNALAQNIAGGNTMVFNSAACELITQSAANTRIVSHDWWAYIIITAVGGHVIFDNEPCLLYRQHDNNLVGGLTNNKTTLRRITSKMLGQNKTWNDSHISALQDNKRLLTKKNLTCLYLFDMSRRQRLPTKLLTFSKSGIFRQSHLGTILMFFLLAIDKF